MRCSMVALHCRFGGFRSHIAVIGAMLVLCSVEALLACGGSLAFFFWLQPLRKFFFLL